MFQSVVQTKCPDNGYTQLDFGIVSAGILRVYRTTRVPGHMRRLHNADGSVPNAIVHQHRGQRVWRHVHDALRVQHAHVQRCEHHPNHAVLSLRISDTHAADVLCH